MACSDEVFYTNTDIIITLSPEDSSWSVSDVQEFAVTITKSEDGEVITKTYTGGDIVISGTDLLLYIDDTDITDSGWYRLSFVLTSTAGQIITLQNCTYRDVFFYDG